MRKLSVECMLGVAKRAVALETLEAEFSEVEG
jgi:hypothetical protein